MPPTARTLGLSLLTAAVAAAAVTVAAPARAATVPTDAPVGFASVNANGQNGTTGGVGGASVTVSTTDGLLAAIDTVGPLVIFVSGTINITSKQGVRPNKTILGLGTTARINGGGFDFYKSFNVIVRNLTFTDADDDSINVGKLSHHIWIDHNDFYPAADGSVDIVRGADYVTVSWNHFHATDKTMLIGHSDSNGPEDTGHLKVTIHHNWFDGSTQRHPRVRFGEPVHVYNNYYTTIGLYAVASVENAGVLVEGNYLENVAHPFYAKSGYADSGPGRLVQRGNVYVNSGSPTDEATGTVTEPRTYYSYQLDSATAVPTLVRNGVGVGKLGL
jgi:pectate lyase